MGLIISYCSRPKLSGVFYPTLKKEIYLKKQYSLPITSYILDHIIPWILTQDDSLNNLRLLTLEENKIKTKMDWIILKQLRKEGYTQKVTNYSVELLASPEELKDRYLELWYEYTQENNKFDFINKSDRKPGLIYSLV
jgi:hypothetical protein